MKKLFINLNLNTLKDNLLLSLFIIYKKYDRDIFK